MHRVYKNKYTVQVLYKLFVNISLLIIYQYLNSAILNLNLNYS